MSHAYIPKTKKFCLNVLNFGISFGWGFPQITLIIFFIRKDNKFDTFWIKKGKRGGRFQKTKNALLNLWTSPRTKNQWKINNVFLWSCLNNINWVTYKVWWYVWNHEFESRLFYKNCFFSFFWKFSSAYRECTFLIHQSLLHFVNNFFHFCQVECIFLSSKILNLELEEIKHTWFKRLKCFMIVIFLFYLFSFF